MRWSKLANVVHIPQRLGAKREKNQRLKWLQKESDPVCWYTSSTFLQINISSQSPGRNTTHQRETKEERKGDRMNYDEATWYLNFTVRGNQVTSQAPRSIALGFARYVL
jgi:hypothetical protein